MNITNLFLKFVFLSGSLGEEEICVATQIQFIQNGNSSTQTLAAHHAERTWVVRNGKAKAKSCTRN
jgi:hypothetical protein